MRRLILEFSINEFKKSQNIDVTQLKKVKTLEILQVLRQDLEEIVAIGRIDVEEEVSNIEDFIKLINDNAYEVKLLSEKKADPMLSLLNKESQNQ